MGPCPQRGLTVRKPAARRWVPAGGGSPPVLRTSDPTSSGTRELVATGRTPARGWDPVQPWDPHPGLSFGVMGLRRARQVALGATPVLCSAQGAWGQWGMPVGRQGPVGGRGTRRMGYSSRGSSWVPQERLGWGGCRARARRSRGARPLLLRPGAAPARHDRVCRHHGEHVEVLRRVLPRGTGGGTLSLAAGR